MQSPDEFLNMFVQGPQETEKVRYLSSTADA